MNKNSVEIKLTEDGSHTLYAVNYDECYHSTHGAVQESLHIFINEGFLRNNKKEITVFEVGFGTGLNAFLTFDEVQRSGKDVKYISVEKFPISGEDADKLNYSIIVNPEYKNFFLKLHEIEWNRFGKLTQNFSICKFLIDFTQFVHIEMYDVVYFDAFSPEKQPEMWSVDVFKSIYQNCNSGAVLTTYCAKGMVKKNLLEAGFLVEKIPGPPGKRHILRAIKP